MNKAALGITIGCALLLVLGNIGFSMEGEVEDIPTPNVPDVLFFSDDPLPTNGLSFFFDAEALITWDRSDVVLVIVDEDFKNTCEAIPPGLLGAGGTQCTYRETGIISGGDGSDNEDGIKWTSGNEINYVGIATPGHTLPSDVTLNVHYEVDLSASFTFNFLLILGLIASGAWLKKSLE